MSPRCILSTMLVLCSFAMQVSGQSNGDASLLCVDPAASASPCTADGRERAVAPGLDRRVNVASATRSPWINANAWRFRRNPTASYLYEADEKKAALALAEAFTYGVRAAVRNSGGSTRATSMLQFVSALDRSPTSVVADVIFIDDGTPQAGEAMNLLSRRNILFRRVSEAETTKGKVVRIGSSEFPKALLANPSEFAYKVRRWLGDENRLLRVYGTENILAYVTGNDRQLRVCLLNYAPNPAEGIRVKLRGRYTDVAIRIFDVPDAKPQDVSTSGDATEFTIRLLHEFAVIDLKR